MEKCAQQNQVGPPKPLPRLMQLRSWQISLKSTPPGYSQGDQSVLSEEKYDPQIVEESAPIQDDERGHRDWYD